MRRGPSGRDAGIRFQRQLVLEDRLHALLEREPGRALLMTLPALPVPQERCQPATVGHEIGRAHV